MRDSIPDHDGGSPFKAGGAKILGNALAAILEQILILNHNQSEEVGFEPTIPLRGFLFSRQTQSATLPLFHRNRYSLCGWQKILKEIEKETAHHSR
jgi:hypothetical protein